MQRKNIIIATAVAALVGAGALALGTSSYAQPYGGGYMGPGMMGGYGPGPGYGAGHGYGPGWMHGWMHGRGYGPRWMHGGRGYGPCGGYDGTDGKTTPPAKSGEAAPQQTEPKLTVDDVKARMERWLSFRHNPRLKVGDVKEKDDNTITADIVTVDNSLVQRFTVDRNTGFYRPEEGN